MSLVPPYPEFGCISREREVRNAVENQRVCVAVTMLIECGGVGAFRIALEEQEEAIRTNFRHATGVGLRDAGVLDESFNVIPGQEEYVEQYGLGEAE